MSLLESAQNLVSELPDNERELISDGYHTFKELYQHRIDLWIGVCRVFQREVAENGVWRTRLHSDGTSWDGWFVLGIGFRDGLQLTYHLPESKWDECGFATVLDKSPDFDGHSSADVLERLKKL